MILGVEDSEISSILIGGVWNAVSELTTHPDVRDSGEGWEIRSIGPEVFSAKLNNYQTIHGKVSDVQAVKCGNWPSPKDDLRAAGGHQ